jgi:CRP-like cAMP-binding protein
MSSFTEEHQRSKSSEFQENLEILRQMDFFSALTLEALKVLAYLCSREKFKAGDYLFRQDDNDGNAFYIISGTAELERQDGGGGLILRQYSEGEFLGGLALLADLRRLFSLKASTDVTCLILNRDKFSKALEQFPELTPRVFKSVVERVRAWEEHLILDRSQLCDACRLKLGVSLI